MERIIRLRKEAREQGNPVLRDKSFELLLKTIREKKPKSILEIGVNVGLSGIAMLLENSEATLSGIEIDEECIKKAKANYREFGVENRAKIFFGDAGEIIPILTGKYDFIFLDGPKGHYYEYLPYLLNSLNKGGILFADNVLFRGYVEDETPTPHRQMTIKRSMQNFLYAIENNEGLKTTIYHIEDGVSITEKLYE
ncbi:MAG: O-methyltransferase [Firmicutes bacterium]|nr:O-methyltransferase [Candidatus Caballimonas caccae]